MRRTAGLPTASGDGRRNLAISGHDHDGTARGSVSSCATSGGAVRARVVLVCSAVVVAGVTMSACGGSSSPSSLKPSALGKGQCQGYLLASNAGYGQFAISGASCSDAEAVASAVAASDGSTTKADGYTCKSKIEGPDTKWSSSFGGTYYSYSCSKGGNRLAFNWGLNYIYESVIVPPSPVVGALQPAALGSGECQASSLPGGSTYAQIDAANAGCTTSVDLAEQAATAKGASFAWNGFQCTGAAEGAGSTWATAWSGTYYAYSCADGVEQVAFNWGTNYIYAG
jgi:hypothetical protein